MVIAKCNAIAINTAASGWLHFQYCLPSVQETEASPALHRVVELRSMSVSSH